VKIALANYQGRRSAGLVDDELQTWTLISGQDDVGSSGLTELIGERLKTVDATELSLAGSAVPLSDVAVLAPIPRPRRNIICVGKNYYDHAAEFSASGFDQSDTGADDHGVPSHPIFFTKAPSTVIGPDDSVDSHRQLTRALDYEAEIAVIIGRGGTRIPRSSAWEHVWGYTIVNDVTARDLQRDHAQWFLGKSLDTFCPMGPWIVTADEVSPKDMTLSCWVNGELRQHASATDLIFDVPCLIETLSAGLTLQTGDIIATGTPAGVGIGLDPQRFLQPGDDVSISVTGLGTLRNTIGE
jgi:2-keto-4-pentenoate hydratase/2-oxohepta-3-ene-1,7-dioic acid hydratase in catechol pathway